MTSMLPTPTDPSGRLVLTALGPVNVVEEGAGPAAAIMVHGMPGSTRDWRYLAPVLAARGVRAVRFDLPGFGGTPLSSSRRATVVDTAGLIYALADALRLDRFALIGHSFGGALALTATVRIAHVAALALVNAPGPLRHRGYMLPATAHQATALLLGAPFIGERYAPIVHEAFVGAGFTKGVPKDAPSLAFIAGLIASLDFRAIRRELRAVDCPVLVASAHDDPLVEPFIGRATIAALPTTTMRSHLHVKEGGHYLQKHQAIAIGEWVADRLVG